MTKQIEAALWGTITQSGELRTSANGNSYGMTSLVVDSGNRDNDGKDLPAFVKIFAFGTLANVAANLKKGGQAYAEGRLGCGLWQPENGATRLNLTLKVTKLEPTQIGRNKERKRPDDSPRPDPQAPLENRSDFGDEIPF